MIYIRPKTDISLLLNSMHTYLTAGDKSCMNGTIQPEDGTENIMGKT